MAKKTIKNIIKKKYVWKWRKKGEKIVVAATA